jgi:hypothetical protein
MDRILTERGYLQPAATTSPSPRPDSESGWGEISPTNSRIEPLNHRKSSALKMSMRGNNVSLSALCGVGGAKWGEGRGEVPRFTIHWMFDFNGRPSFGCWLLVVSGVTPKIAT